MLSDTATNATQRSDMKKKYVMFNLNKDLSEAYSSAHRSVPLPEGVVKMFNGASAEFQVFSPGTAVVGVKSVENTMTSKEAQLALAHTHPSKPS